MTEMPAVLVLVVNADRREEVRQRLFDLDVTPIAVRADHATKAVSQFKPISVVIDEAHASTAPDEFLETMCSHHVRLVTLPDADAFGVAGEAALRYAVSMRPAI